MPVLLTNPGVVPAQPERAYPELWLSQLHIVAPEVGPTRVFGTVQEARTLADGSKEFRAGAEKRIQIDDFFGQADAEAAQGNTEMYQVMGALLNLIKRKGNL